MTYTQELLDGLLDNNPFIKIVSNKFFKLHQDQFDRLAVSWWILQKEQFQHEQDLSGL